MAEVGFKMYILLYICVSVFVYVFIIHLYLYSVLDEITVYNNYKKQQFIESN